MCAPGSSLFGAPPFLLGLKRTYAQKMLSSTNLLSAGEVGQATADERIAVMEAVKAGRVSIDEAILAIKSVAISKSNPATPNTQRRRTTKARKQAEKEVSTNIKHLRRGRGGKEREKELEKTKKNG